MGSRPYRPPKWQNFIRISQICPSHRNTRNFKILPKILHLNDRQFDDEDILEEIIKDFRIWLKNIENDFNLSFYRTKHQFTETDNVTCFVTWTDWDIGNQLIHEL